MTEHPTTSAAETKEPLPLKAFVVDLFYAHPDKAQAERVAEAIRQAIERCSPPEPMLAIMNVVERPTAVVAMRAEIERANLAIQAARGIPIVSTHEKTAQAVADTLASIIGPKKCPTRVASWKVCTCGTEPLHCYWCGRTEAEHLEAPAAARASNPDTHHDTTEGQSTP